MKNLLTGKTKMKTSGKAFLLGLMLASIQVFVCEPVSAQTKKQNPATTPTKKAAAANLPKVTRIDSNALKNLLRREGENAKPLLINFWATWCDPCREEFPDLVKIDADYKGKIDFITISLDELSELNTGVPKFLASMNATMPAYLLKTDDEEAAIGSVSKDWQGGLPFTILINAKGATSYSKQGKFKPDILRAEIDKAAASGDASRVSYQQIENPSILEQVTYSYAKGVEEARKDVTAGKLLIKRYGLTVPVSARRLKKLKESYGIEIVEHGCLVFNGFVDYIKGYNETSTAEIKRKFGNKALETLEKE